MCSRSLQDSFAGRYDGRKSRSNKAVCKIWVDRRRVYASYVNTNCGTSTERSNASSLSPARNARSSPAAAPRGPAITVALLGTRLTSVPSAQANLGVKNSSRPKRKSKARTNYSSRSSANRISSWNMGCSEKSNWPSFVITIRRACFSPPNQNGDHGSAREDDAAGKELQSRYRWSASACPFASIQE